jgi:hypothetical protein
MLLEEGQMATYLIRFPATATFTLAVIAAVMVASISLMLRKRSVASRVRILLISSFCLLALMWCFGSLNNPRVAAAMHSIVPAHAVAPAAPSAKVIAVSTRRLESPRAVYGHSIVKGGIHSLAQLLDVIATDPLAAQHYKGFDVTHARFIRLDHNIMAYVSYRIDGAGIYWTSHPVLIMAGEEVITDGTNYIRVRCGNMISYAQQSPISLDDEPTDTDTIVEYVPPPTGYAEDFSTVNGPLTSTQSDTPPPPIQTEGPGGVYTPPPMFFPPPTKQVVPIDEYGSHGAFYSLFGALLLLFVVERLHR